MRLQKRFSPTAAKNIEGGRERWKNLVAAPLRDGYMCLLDKSGTSRKVGSSVTPNFIEMRNCRVLEVLLPGSDIATFGSRKTEGR
jgi:hypothetical protein